MWEQIGAISQAPDSIAVRMTWVTERCRNDTLGPPCLAKVCVSLRSDPVVGAV